MADFVTTQEAAELAGVGASTIKRWADEGRLVCTKTLGGHRRIDRDSLEQVIAAETPMDDWIVTLLEEDEHALLSKLLSLRARAQSWARAADLAGHVLSSIGEKWARGQLSIIEEHHISDRLARACRKVADLIPLRPNAPIALLACAEDDEHTLGLTLCELVLREAGYATRWAGRATPARAVCDAVRRGGIQLVALSASVVSNDAASLRKQAAAVADACAETDTQLFLGGAGAWPDVPGRIRSFVELSDAAI